MKDHFDFDSVCESFYTDSEKEKLSRIHVGIAGAGGLGSNCALALARSGFCKFTIADFDCVAVSNLNRQLYFPFHIGRSKVECLSEIIVSLNSSAEILQYTSKITIDNVHSVFDSCDCIVEAFDNAESKAMIVSELAGSTKLVVSVSGLGGYGNSDRIVTRKVRQNLFIIGDETSEVGEYVKPFAPCVLIAAAKQADVVLEWALTNYP